MDTKKLKFRVDATPVAQPRARVGVMVIGGKPQARVYDDKKHPVFLWRMFTSEAYRAAAQGHIFRGPVTVRLDFVMPRPKSKVWKKKQMVREWDVRGGRNDCDNLAKGTLDALTQAGAWTDDSQIVGLIITKVMAGDEDPHAIINISSPQGAPPCDS